MDRKDIDKAAYNHRPLPKWVSDEDKLYMLIVSNVYDKVKYDNLSKDEAIVFKAETIRTFDNLIKSIRPSELELACRKAYCEAIIALEKLIQPRANMKDKTQQELLDIISEYEAVLAGIFDKDSVPEFLKY